MTSIPLKQIIGNLKLQWFGTTDSNNSSDLPNLLRQLNRILMLSNVKLSEETQIQLLTKLEENIEIKQLVNGKYNKERLAVNCIADLLPLCKKNILQENLTLYNILLENLRKLTQKLKENKFVLLTSSTLRCFSRLLQVTKTVELDNVREILKIVKLCAFYYPNSIPNYNFTTVDYLSDSSDSDQNESTTGRDYSWRIRLHGIEVLGSLGNINQVKKIIWSIQFSSFLFPIHSFTPLNPFGSYKSDIIDKLAIKANERLTRNSFYQILIFDPSIKVRTATATALASIFNQSNLYISIADDKISIETPYVGVAQQLGSALQQIHFAVLFELTKLSEVFSLPERALKDSVQLETHLESLMNLLFNLLSNCCYNRLSAGYLSSFYSILFSLIQRTDGNIKLNTIACFSKLFDTIQIPENEITDILQTDPGTIQELFVILNNELELDTIKIQALQCLTNICKSYETHITNHISTLFDHINAILMEKTTKTNYQLQIAGLKLLLQIIKDKSDEKKHKIFNNFFDQLINFINPNYCTFSSVTSFTYLLLAQYPFDMISEKDCSILLGFLHKALFSTFHSVISSSLHFLSNFIGFCEIPSFIKLVAARIYEIIRESRFPISVKEKAFNFLAIFCEHLPLKNINFLMHEKEDSLILIKLFQTTAELYLENKYNEKIKINFLRAIGYFGQFVNNSILQNQIKIGDKLEPISGVLLKILLDSINSNQHAKIQWNGCYSLFSVFHNEALYELSGIDDVLKLIYLRLGDAVTQSSNYKIRINAANALSVPNSKCKFKTTFEVVLESVQNSFNNLDQPGDFVDFCYLPKLNEQLSATLAHLTSLTNC